MAVNAFLRFDGVDGESVQRGHERWIEVNGWDWEIEAESSWTKGGGASVGKPQPGALTWTHAFDTASIPVLARIAAGKSLPKAELHAVRSGDGRSPEPYLTAVFEAVFITKVTNSTTEEGNVVQQVSMVFKKVTLDYRKQDPTGKLGTPSTFSWDIPAGVVSPSS